MLPLPHLHTSHSQAAEDLIIYPFDDIAQSAYYLPWAILRVDEGKAVEVRDGISPPSDWLKIALT